MILLKLPSAAFAKTSATHCDSTEFTVNPNVTSDRLMILSSDIIIEEPISTCDMMSL